MDRTELLAEKVQALEVAAVELKILMDRTDLNDVDAMSVRAAIERAQADVRRALVPLDRRLTRTHMGSHERVGDYVIMVSTKKDSETYRGGDSKTLRHEVAMRLAEQLTGVQWDEDSPEAAFARDLADAIAGVWTQPPKSKLPSKKALKNLGLEPSDWFTVELGSGVKVDVMDVELYEAKIGPAPKETRFEDKVGEPF